MKKILLSLMCVFLPVLAWGQDSVIQFADETVRNLCIQNWDTNGDGAFSMSEAGAVTTLEEVFRETEITSFDELQYFTGLTEINSQAFSGCMQLQTITLPSSITAIGEGAFMMCDHLSSITIPASVTSIGESAFWECMNLEEIRCYVANPFAIPYNVFFQVTYATATLHVLQGTAGLYQNTESWNEFANIIDDLEDQQQADPEPYAVLSDNNTVLTFYHDENRERMNGMSVGPFLVTESASWYKNRETITTVVFDNSFANYTDLTSTRMWFEGCEKLSTIIGIENLSTSNVTDMSCMFLGCTALTSLDVSNFNTSNVTNMYAMFDGCSGLTSLDVSNFNTSNVTNMGGMFDGCSGLTSLNVSNFNTSNVTDMSLMFQTCTALTSLNLSNFNTSNVTDMMGMFGACIGLTSLNVSNFNTSNVTNMDNMFYACSSLATIDVSNFNTLNVTRMYSMFESCSGLATLDLSNFNTSNVVRMNKMFGDCQILRTIYVGEDWNTESVTIGDQMFEGCTSLVGGAGTKFSSAHTDYTYAHIDGGIANPGYFTAAGAEPWTEPNEPEPYAVLSDNNTVLTFYYDDQKAARNGMDVGPFEIDYDIERDREYINSGWDEQRESITNVVFDASFANCTSITSTYGWFYKCDHLTTITGISNLKTDNITDMSNMFRGCSAITSLDLSGFNTQNVTSIYSMFQECSSLSSLNISGFNTANVTYMTYMFQGCSSLTSLDLSHFNTANVTNMESMFQGCSSLDNLDISGFNTVKVRSMAYMFLGCSSLTSLDLSRFNTEGVVDMGSMFQGCSRLTSLDLSGFNTANVTRMSTMFAGCSSLISLDLSGFRTEKVTLMGGMFQGCSSLTSLDIRGFQPENVTQMQSMFSGCSSLTSLDLSNFRTDNATNMNAMFNGCSGLTSLDVSAFKTDSVTIMSLMFQNCSGLTSLDVSGFNTEHVVDMLYMFQGCSSLTSLDLSGFTTNNVMDMTSMFGGCSNLTTIYAGEGWSTASVTEDTYMFDGCTNLVGGEGTLYDQNHTDVAYAHIDGGTANPGYFTAAGAEPWTEPNEPEPYAALSDNNTVLTFYYDDQKEARNGMSVGPFTGIGSGWYENRETITNVVFDASFANCTTLTSTAYWFYGLKNLTTITDIGNLKTDNVTDMGHMFFLCSSLTSLDVSGFKTDNVTNMESMFYGCSSLTSLDLSSFNTENVTDMSMMFQECYALQELNISSFNTSKVTSFFQTFLECYNLEHLDVSSFNTENVRSMRWMFGYCSRLTSLDVSNFNTENVTNMGEMFYVCSSLTTLDLSNFNTQSLTNMWGMFRYCSSLVNVNISNFNTSNVTNNNMLFDDCSSLASIQAGSAAIPDSVYAQVGNPNLLVYVNEASLAPEGVQNVVINGQAQEIILTDVTEGNNNWNCPQAFTAERISYTRNFQQQTEVGISRGWESIALPFNVQTITHETQGQIVPFGTQGKNFWLRGYSPDGLYNAAVIEANTPYVISMPNNTEVYFDECNLNGRVTFEATNTTVPATPDIEDMVITRGNITMAPIFVQVPRDEMIYAINVGQPYNNYAEGSVFVRELRDVRPFEALTIHEAINGARPNCIRIAAQPRGDSTGINTIESDSAEDSWYSIDGRQMQSQPKAKGIYIHKGKKVVK